jgi:hypothetical protein
MYLWASTVQEYMNVYMQMLYAFFLLYSLHRFLLLFRLMVNFLALEGNSHNFILHPESSL